MNLLIILFLINFLRTIFIIVIIYYGIRLFTRYILPLLLDKGVKKMQQKMQEQQQQNERNRRREGEVTIETNQRNSKNSTVDKGDYIDFEEVD